jgi:hypothetical protein
MRAQASGLAERAPRRAGQAGPARSSSRGELAAGLAAAAVVVELLLAQLSLLLTGCLVAIARLTRWRPHWLAWPAAAGLAWTLATGPARAAAGFAGWPRQLAAYLAPAASQPGPAAISPARLAGSLRQLPHPVSFLAYLGHWLPRQLPVAMVAASAQAAVVLWLGWRRAGAANQAAWRPGPVASIRLRRNASELAAGHAVTRDGCALGLAAGTGRLAGFSWADASRGVLLTSQDEQASGRLALAAAGAAMRLRKTVVVIDLAGTAGRLTELASSLGVPASTCPLAAPGELAGQAGLAIRGRSVLLVSGDHAADAPAGLRPGQQAVATLLAVLADLRDLGLRGDCLAWISGCEGVGMDLLTQLTDLGPATGTAVMLSTADAGRAGDLESAAAVVVAVQTEARFTITARDRPQRPVVYCRSVPAGPGRGRAGFGVAAVRPDSQR